MEGEGKADIIIQRPIIKSDLSQKLTALFGQRNGDATVSGGVFPRDDIGIKILPISTNI